MSQPYESDFEKSIKAIQNDDFIALGQLLSDDPMLTKGVDREGANLLHYAAALGNAKAFILMSNAGTDLWHKDVYGDTPVDFLNTPSDDSGANEGKQAIKDYLAEKSYQPATKKVMEEKTTIRMTLGEHITSLRDKFFHKNNQDNRSKPE